MTSRREAEGSLVELEEAVRLGESLPDSGFFGLWLLPMLQAVAVRKGEAEGVKRAGDWESRDVRSDPLSIPLSLGYQRNGRGNLSSNQEHQNHRKKTAGKTSIQKD